MAKYINKKVNNSIVDATQWFKNGDHPLDYANPVVGFENGKLRTWTGEEAKCMGWEGQVVRRFRRPDVDGESICSSCHRKMNDHGWIEPRYMVGSQELSVCPGDWVVTNENGLYYLLLESDFHRYFYPFENEKMNNEKDCQMKDEIVYTPPVVLNEDDVKRMGLCAVVTEKERDIPAAMSVHADRIQYLEKYVHELHARLNGVMIQKEPSNEKEKCYPCKYNVPLANDIDNFSNQLSSIENIVIDILDRLAL